MSGPGGDEVGRVSIRVVPDTSGFRQKLQAAVEQAENGLEVTIPVELGDIDTAGLKAQLEALERSKVTIPVDIGDGTEIERLRARLQALDNSQVTIPVELDLQGEARINAVLQRLRQRTMNLTVKTHGVNQALRELTVLDALVRRLDGRRINIHIDVDAAAAVAQLAALQAALAGLRGSLGSINVGAGSAGAGFRGMARGILMAVAAAALLPPIAFALVTAGAAITAAWGFISSAIAAIPAVLVGLIPAIAAVAIGMDGIKEAAKTLKPEFDRLKVAVDDTFKKGFTEAFNTIRPIMPIIQGGMVGIAKAVSTVAQEFAKFIVRTRDMVVIGEQVGLLETVFNRIQGALIAISPALEDIVYSLMRVAALKILWDALTGAVLRFGNALRDSVDRLIIGGQMQKALEGFGVVLGALSNAFVGLVENGLKVFANAWPGVAKFLDSLTGFFAKFDWERLGTAVSRVFDGLGQALDRIPQGTIDKIVAGFEKLGDTFQDPAFQQGLAGWADAIPPLLSLLNDLTRAFGDMGANVGNFIELIRRVGLATMGLGKIIHGVQSAFLAISNPARFLFDFDGIQRDLDNARRLMQEGVDHIGQVMTEPWPRFGTQATAAASAAVNGIPQAILQPLLDAGQQINTRAAPEIAAAVNALGGRSANAAERAMQQTTAGVQSGLAGMGPAATAGVAPVAPAVGAGLGTVPGAVTTALSPAEAALADAISKFPPVVREGFAGMSADVAAGMAVVAQGITDGMAVGVDNMSAGFTGLVLEAALGMDSLNVTVTDGFNIVSASMTTGLDAVTLAIATGTANWQVAAATGMTAFNDTVTAGFTTMAPAVTVGMSKLNLAVEIGFQSMASAASNGMIVFSTTVTDGFTNMTLAVHTGMSKLNLAVEVGFQSMAGAATNGVLLVQTAITNGFLAVGAAVSLAMNTLTNTLVLGFTTMQTAAANGMIGISTAITTGFTGVNASVTTAMTLFVNAFRLGMNQAIIVVTDSMLALRTLFTTSWAEIDTGVRQAMINMTTIVTDGMTNMQTAVTNGMTQIVDAVRTGMTDVENAIRDGAQRAEQALTTAIRNMVSALNSAVGQFRTAGANMGQALADGLNSKAGAVEAAARRLASAAAAAMRAAAGIRSPSRVFIELGELLGAGLAVGMDKSHLTVKRSAEAMADTVVEGVSSIDDALATDRWATDFNARVNTELAAHDVGASSAARQPVQVVQNFNVPSAERASDKAAHNMRRLGAMGLFGG